MVTVGLLCIVWLTQSLRFIELIVTKGVSVALFLRLTGLLLPSFLITVLPIALFAVVLFTYNRMNADRELIVLRAAGIGPLGLSAPALWCALGTVLIGYALTLHFVPQSVRDFKELQWSVRNDFSSVLLQEGRFNEVLPGVTVYVRARNASGELLGILVEDARDGSTPQTFMAERGALVQGDTGPKVIMVNGSRQQVEPGTGRLSLLRFDSYSMELPMGSRVGGRFAEPRERPLRDLLSATLEDANGREHTLRQFRVEAHTRLASPLTGLSFPLIALAVLLTGSFDRRGNGRRIVLAIGLLFVAEAAVIEAGTLATDNVALVPLIYAAAILPGLAAAAVIFRSYLPRPTREALS